MKTRALPVYEKPHVQRFGTFRDITNEGLVGSIHGGPGIAPDVDAAANSLLVLRESR